MSPLQPDACQATTLQVTRILSAGPCSTRYAFTRGWQARDFSDGPLEVITYNDDRKSKRRHTFPAGTYKQPTLAWSACARYVSLSSTNSGLVHILHVESKAIWTVRTWPCDALAWHPKASWLLTVSAQLALEVYSVEGGQPACMAKVNLCPAFGPAIRAEGSQFVLGASMDCTRVVVSTLGASQGHVVVAQIAQPCVLLGCCVLVGLSSEAMFLSLCVGVSVCAACASTFNWGTVYLIALDGPQIGQILSMVQGVGPALSPCGSFLAVVGTGSGEAEGVSVISLQADNIVVATWTLAEMFGWPLEHANYYGLADVHTHQLTWLPAPPRTGGQAAGQLQLSSLLEDVSMPGQDCLYFRRVWAVLTWLA